MSAGVGRTEWTFTEERWPEFKRRVAAKNRRLETYGIPGRFTFKYEPVSWVVVQERGVPHADAMHGIRATLTSKSVFQATPGWSRVANLKLVGADKHGKGGEWIPIPVEGVDLGDYWPSSDKICQVCTENRRRHQDTTKRMILVRNDTTGEIRKVGSSCVHKYVAVGLDGMSVMPTPHDTTKRGAGKRRNTVEVDKLLRWAWLLSDGGRHYAPAPLPVWVPPEVGHDKTRDAEGHWRSALDDSLEPIWDTGTTAGMVNVLAFAKRRATVAELACMNAAKRRVDTVPPDVIAAIRASVEHIPDSETYRRNTTKTLLAYDDVLDLHTVFLVSLIGDYLAEQARLAQEAEQRRLAQEAEQRRLAQEAEQRRLAQEAEQRRLAQEARRQPSPEWLAENAHPAAKTPQERGYVGEYGEVITAVLVRVTRVNPWRNGRGSYVIGNTRDGFRVEWKAPPVAGVQSGDCLQVLGSVVDDHATWTPPDTSRGTLVKTTLLDVACATIRRISPEEWMAS